MGCVILLIGLYFVFASPERVSRFLGSGQAGVGLMMALWGCSEALPVDRRTFAVVLRVTALTILVSGVALSLLLIVFA